MSNYSSIAELSGELAKLANAACEGTLLPEQQERLEKLLRDDEAARLAYASFLNMHAQMLWRSRGGRSTPAPTTRKTRFGRRLIWWMAVPAAAAALATIGLLGWYNPHASDESAAVVVSVSPDEPPSPKPSLAARSVSVDAAWETWEGATVTGLFSPDNHMPAGTYHLKSGVAEIQLAVGATATLAGPSEIELVEPHTVRLHRGQLAVLVGTKAQRFVVQTPLADIVDKGTEFGVAVEESGDTFVQVYEGWVEVFLHAGGTRQIWPGTALRIAADTAQEPAGVPFEPWRFIRSCGEAAAAKKGGTAVVRDLLTDRPGATDRVRKLLVRLQTEPATPLGEGTIYQDFVSINEMEPAEFDNLVPALLELLGEESYLPSRTGQLIPLRDRAEDALEYLAGIRPVGDDRRAVWDAWWSAAAGESRRSWLAGRRGDFRELLIQWGHEDPRNRVPGDDARRAIEIAARSQDIGVIPILMERLRVEIERPAESALLLAAFVRCLGELADETEWEPVLVPELVDLARQLNRAPRPGELSHEDYPAGTGRRSAMRAFVDTLDRLAGTELGSAALRPVGAPGHEWFEIDETACDTWLKAATR